MDETETHRAHQDDVMAADYRLKSNLRRWLLFVLAFSYAEAFYIPGNFARGYTHGKRANKLQAGPSRATKTTKQYLS